MAGETFGVTYLSVQNLLLPVAQRLDDFEDWVKQSQVTQPPCLIIELLPLCLLGHSHKDVAGLLLAIQREDITALPSKTSVKGRKGSYLQQVV